jgi:hypothetical protein
VVGSGRSRSLISTVVAVAIIYKGPGPVNGTDIEVAASEVLTEIYDEIDVRLWKGSFGSYSCPGRRLICVILYT